MFDLLMMSIVMGNCAFINDQICCDRDNYGNVHSSKILFLNDGDNYGK